MNTFTEKGAAELKNRYLSPNELAVMLVLWNAGRALSRPEILAEIEISDWNPNSIHLILNNLIEKGFVKVSGIARCGKGYGRTYEAVRSQISYGAGLALSVMPDGGDADSVVDMVSAMGKEAGVDSDTILRLEEMLRKYRREIDKEG